MNLLTPKSRLAWPIVAACLLICSCAGDQTNAPAQTWPESNPEEQGLDSAVLAEVIELIDAEDLPIDALLIARNGYLVMEAYFYPYTGDRPHDVASVTKSITSTLVGMAIDQGLLQLDQPVWPLFNGVLPDPADEKASIELQHLLSMSSGLDCGFAPGEPELGAMQQSDDWVRYALELPMANAPGEVFAYCSSGSHVLSALISEVSGQSALDFAKENLFEPLAFGEVEWLADPQGVTRGWGDLRMLPRDMARFGQLFLDEGRWGDAQIVSSDWAREATSRVVDVGDGVDGYGYQWWILGGPLTGLYEARGRSAQAIIVWPEMELVAVFAGRGADSVRSDIAPALLTALQSDQPLQPNPEAHDRLTTAIARALEPPTAQTIPKPPDTAAQVSGNIYQLVENQFGVRCIAVQFDAPADVQLVITFEEGEFAMPIGMDGVPRFSEGSPTGFQVGLTAEWTDSRVFLLHYDELAGANHLQITTEFAEGGATAQFQIDDKAGYFPSQTVAGTTVSQCD